MVSESVYELQAEYALQSTNHLQERREFYKEQVASLHKQPETRGSRSEARARCHLNIIEKELKRRASDGDVPDRRKKPVERSGASLGDILAAKGQSLGHR